MIKLVKAELRKRKAEHAKRITKHAKGKTEHFKAKARKNLPSKAFAEAKKKHKGICAVCGRVCTHFCVCVASTASALSADASATSATSLLPTSADAH